MKTHKKVCNPVLSISAILFLRIMNYSDSFIVYYEMLPRYLNGVIKILRIPKTSLENILSLIFAIKIVRIQHGDSVSDYSDIRIGSYAEMVEISEQLIPYIESDKWKETLNQVLQEESATAALVKFYSRFHLHLYYFPLVLSYKQYCMPDDKMIAICPSSWPKVVFDIINNKLGYYNIEFLKLPAIINLFDKIKNIVKILFTSTKYIFTSPIKLKKTKKVEYKLITEYIDPLRFQKSTFDANFCVDDDLIQSKDVLFYLTDRQLKVLNTHGYSKKQLIKQSKDNNYNLVALKDLPFTASFIKNHLKVLFRLLLKTFKYRNSITLDMMPYIWYEYMMHVRLFLNFKVDKSLHIQIPNGRSDWRWNSAIITGLSRQFNTISYGCQTRVLDTRQYEHCFECYDIWFSWGTAWNKLLGSGQKYIHRTIETGILFLDKELISFYKEKENEYFQKEKEKPLKVILFSTDIDLEPTVFGGSFYTKGYTMDFLISCIKLAKNYPKVQFVLKSKDPEHVDIIKKDERFMSIFRQLTTNNFEFLKLERCNYMDILMESDIAISIGFTSPGLEAKILGKPSIYYSQIKNAGQVFKSIPYFVAESQNELNILFNKALKKTRKRLNHFELDVQELDPYQDGEARNRIIKILS